MNHHPKNKIFPMHRQSWQYEYPRLRLRLASPILAIVGLYVFATAFFLAKKSLPHISTCTDHSARDLLLNVLQFTNEEVGRLEHLGILSTSTPTSTSTDGDDNGDIVRNGCWMPRRVDALAIIVVDALRFDFALQHLPKSIGSRLTYDREGQGEMKMEMKTKTKTKTTEMERKMQEKVEVEGEVKVGEENSHAKQNIDKEQEQGQGQGQGHEKEQKDERPHSHSNSAPDGMTSNTSKDIHNNNNSNNNNSRGSSQLYKFVADPPTVTMQRLKGLTTGGLPTFADISGSFGGANIDEDNWVQQLRDVPVNRRGMIDLDKKLNMDMAIMDMDTSRNLGDTNHHDKKSSGGGKIVSAGGVGGVDADSTLNGDTNKSTNANTNTLKMRNVQMGFVGDDTWVDLFPNQFDDSHPYPSFNTRDLDTVDDGCMEHLPRLLKSFGPRDEATGEYHQPFFEVLVAHFLGVDHVGHTYGPHNEHMDEKLGQMDDILQTIMAKIDDAKEQCQVIFVFGDHGMTEHGNHGGGTDEEINAALFAHFSPGCGDMGPSLSFTGSEVGAYSEEAFRSINQIDLVPTISILLGLPIPYANLGGAVPALLPPLYHRRTTKHHPQSGSEVDLVEAPFAATVLALNAAQVWDYLTTYSTTANRLPVDALSDLEEILDQATLRLRSALSQSDGFDSIEYREACGLYKYFLSQATDLGKKVWTRFDTLGMASGIALLILSVVLFVPSLISSEPNNSGKDVHHHHKLMTATRARSPMAKLAWKRKVVEGAELCVFLIFQCILLTFSNSYIVSEESIVMFMLSVLCITTTTFRYLGTTMQHGQQHTTIRQKSVAALPMVVMFCSRLNNLFVRGHGLDPMIRKYLAHSPYFFLPSLIALAAMRYRYDMNGNASLVQTSNIMKFHLWSDIAITVLLGTSWIEKRSLDISRHGYMSSKLSLLICIVGMMVSCAQIYFERDGAKGIPQRDQKREDHVVQTKIALHGQQPLSGSLRIHMTSIILLKVMFFIVTVTGPAAAASSIFFLTQAWALTRLMYEEKGIVKISAPMLAAMWRLSIRHAFFATGHACSFNRLQFSAAFVASETFKFYTAGVSLFMNTFGWDILGICFLASVSKASNRPKVYTCFCFYQLLETVASCISVSLMRRHLFVWAIFAPRFVFGSIFLLICNVFYIANVIIR